MRATIYTLLFVSTLVVAPQFAFADDNGAGAGIVGGAVAGAIVGGPVGAVVGGVAGGAIGGAATGPRHDCNTRTVQTTDSNGVSRTTQSTNCPN
jgi:hypothetical protein